MIPTAVEVPRINTNTCAVGPAGADGCRACVEHCPYDAMEVRTQPDGSEIRIDPLACQRCGACSGVCPTSSIERPFLSDAELIDLLSAAARSAEGPVLGITCPDSAGRVQAALGTDRVVMSPSLLIVNETHLLAAIAAGARAVLLVGCPRCTHDQASHLREPLSVLRAMVDEPRRALYVEDDRTDRFEVAVRDAASLMAPALTLDVPARQHLADATTRRERLAILLAALGPGGTTPLAAPGFGRVELHLDACVACGACAGACPTGALAMDPTVASLSVTDLDCVGCGICASVCPDDAIHVTAAVPTGTGALHPRQLLTDEPVACRSCGTPYAPARLLDHARVVLQDAGQDPDDPRFQLGVCGPCRDVEARQVPLPADTPADDHHPSRRRFLQGAATAVAIGTALPLFRGTRPAIAVEHEPVIKPGRLGMVIDLDRCIGCHACTNACKAENNVPLGKFRDWVEEHVIGEYPDARPVFLPKLCNHCDDPGCLRACPTGAIHKRADGIVDLDPEICIACQACMHGCPYGMTFYNHQRGTADKCNLCAHRIDEGLNPACVEVCPSQCRIVGDFDDPESPVSAYLRDREGAGLREDYGLGPNVRYVGLPGDLNR